MITMLSLFNGGLVLDSTAWKYNKYALNRKIKAEETQKTDK